MSVNQLFLTNLLANEGGPDLSAISAYAWQYS